VLDRDIFNWSVFPKFSELSIGECNAIKYCPVTLETPFRIGSLEFRMFPTDHKVPSAGVLVKDSDSSVLISGDTANLSGLDSPDKYLSRLSAMLVECAFPDELCEIAKSSHHMTPSKLGDELRKISFDCPVYVFNIKANYRDAVVDQINALNIPNLEILEIGKTYFF
jgi:cAMP phosphodiesterase